MTSEIIIARAIANGNEVLATFTGAPKDGSFNGIPDGTVFVIPTDFEGKIFANKKFSGAQYTIVTGEGTTDGYEFYPSSCGKQFFVVNPDGSKKTDAEGHQEVLRPTGNFAQLYREATSVNDFMMSMRGKRIKLTYPEANKVLILKYGTADTKEVTIPCFEIVG